jgi:hypothetical protein
MDSIIFSCFISYHLNISKVLSDLRFKLLVQGERTPMRDKTLGALMCILGVLAMTGYFYWLFLVPQDLVFLGRPLSDWAVILPVAIIVYVFLFVIVWIGWTMVSTPPPLPVAPKSSEEKKETEKKE